MSITISGIEAGSFTLRVRRMGSWLLGVNSRAASKGENALSKAGANRQMGKF